MSYPPVNINYPVGPNTTAPLFPKTVADISMRHDAWNQEIINCGIRVFLYKSLPCPNKRGIEERTHPAQCSICGNDGYIYPLPPIEVTALIHNSSDRKEYTPQTMLQQGEIYFSFPTSFEGVEIDVSVFDRFVVQGVFCRMWTQFEFEANTVYKSTQPIHAVEALVSVRSNSVFTWTLGLDFEIEDEGIRFITQPTLGEFFSVMFYTYPAYTITSLSHDFRVGQVLDGNIKKTVRLPQSGIAARDFLVKD